MYFPYSQALDIRSKLSKLRICFTIPERMVIANVYMKIERSTVINEDEGQRLKEIATKYGVAI